MADVPEGRKIAFFPAYVPAMKAMAEVGFESVDFEVGTDHKIVPSVAIMVRAHGRVVAQPVAIMSAETASMALMALMTIVGEQLPITQLPGEG